MSFVKIAREFLEAVKSDLTGFTSKDPEIKVGSFKEVTLLTPEHIQFAKYGRGPGKQPPIDSILKFVGEKGIIFEDTDQEGTAWAIAKSIAKKGTSNWVPNAPNAIEEAVNNHILDYYQRLSNFYIEVYDKDIQNVYDKIYPSKISVKL